MTTATTPPIGPMPSTWPAEPGTYLLVLRLTSATELTVGRLGSVAMTSGWYVYVGSALGGLAPRLRRHLRATKPRHWHVDSLREVASVVGVAYRIGPERLECEVVARLAALAEAARPIPRFGSSDCRCRSHLLRFAQRPELRLGSDWMHVALA